MAVACLLSGPGQRPQFNEDRPEGLCNHRVREVKIMRQTILTAGLVLALGLSARVAVATPVSCAMSGTSVTTSNAICNYDVTETGLYDIVAAGGQGGNSGATALGGQGAEIGGYFYLSAGEILDIAVGGEGGSGADVGGGGGGGSFVVLQSGSTPLIVAGGGGGTSGNAEGLDGTTGPSGDGGAISTGGGNGGAGGEGGGGAGYYENGANGSSAAGGSDFADGLSGGVNDDGLSDSGGFGGGGGGGDTPDAAGGGGGGYGGGSGGNAFGPYVIAGGGGSYDGGIVTDPLVLERGVNPGNGYVDITFVPASVPEPGALALFGSALVGFGFFGFLRRRRHKAA